MICSSPMEPNVVTVSTCVCPLVKRPEPWTRGRMPTSQLTGRTSSRARPSGRIFSCVIIWRTIPFSIRYRIWAISFTASGYSSVKCTMVSSLMAEMSASRASLSLFRVAASRRASAYERTFSSSSSDTLNTAGICFSFPQVRCMFCWNSTSRRISACPKRIASKTISSGSSFAPASTIMTASYEPATVKFKSESARCSSVGLMTNEPLI